MLAQADSAEFQIYSNQLVRGTKREPNSGRGKAEGGGGSCEAMSNGNRMNDSIRHQIFTADV